MSQSVPPPSHQEITRKLSVHSVAKPTKKPAVTTNPVSGTESDSDSQFATEVISPSPLSAISLSAQLITGNSAQPPLSSIAERRSGSGGEESEEDEDEEGGWHAESVDPAVRGSLDETVLKTGYLWKKGERRKTWKKRWFVLRPAHLAFYKTSAEYKLLRLLDLSEIHSCTRVELKKHANTFGLVSPKRTFYLQAESQLDAKGWVQAISDAKVTLMATSTQTSATAPIPIPTTPSAARTSYQTTGPISTSPSHSPHNHLTSSDSEGASPNGPRSYAAGSVPASLPGEVSSPTKQTGALRDASKPILSGYLMKCGSRRHHWRNRWFVLSGEKLVYCRSHMDNKPHRQIPLAQILDAFEYDLPSHRHNPNMTISPVSSPQLSSSAPDGPDDGQARHTFKVVTTKRMLLLCAPSEEEEIKWLSAVRALIARRSGSGVLPGDSAASTTAASRTNANANSSSAGAGAGGGVLATSLPAGGGAVHMHGGASSGYQDSGTTHGAGSGISGSGGGSSASFGVSKRRDSLARRLSLSGGGGFTGSATSQEVGI